MESLWNLKGPNELQGQQEFSWPKLFLPTTLLWSVSKIKRREELGEHI